MMHKALAGSELILLDQCAHFSPLEQAEKVSQALIQWYSLGSTQQHTPT